MTSHSTTEPTSRLWLLALAALLLSLWSWALASPVGASPDEDFHLASIWCAPNAHTELCGPGNEASNRSVSTAVTAAACFAFDARTSAACQNLNPAQARLELTERGNFKSNYPPIFYWTMSTFASGDIAASVIVMRLVNATLLVLALGVTLWLSRPRLRLPALLAVTVSSVPLGMFILSSINPSSWAVMLVPTSWLALYGSLTATDGRRKAGLAGMFFITGVLAAGARGDAAAYVGVATLLALVLSWDRDGFIRRNRVVLSIIAGGGLAAALFFLTSAQANVLVNGIPGSNSTATATLGGGLKLLVGNLSRIPSLWMGNFGTWGLGWIDTPMPEGVVFCGLFAVGALLFASLGAARRQHWWGLGIAIVALTVVPLAILQLSSAKVGELVQPRYILPLLVLFVVIASTIPTTWDRRALVPVTIGLALLVLANGLALFTNVMRYSNGLGNGYNLSSPAWWWGPWSPALLIAAGGLSFAALCALIAFGLWRARAAEPAAELA